MGGGSQPRQLSIDSWFLRRINFPNLVRRGEVDRGVFKPRKTDLTSSYTLQNERLQTTEGLYHYRLKWTTREQVVPGLCRLSYADLDRASLPPRHDPDPTDPEYGELHCSTDLPSREQQVILAKRASENGIIALPEAYSAGESR